MKRLSYTLWSLSALFIAIGITSCSNEDAPKADVISNEIKAQFESLGFDVSDIEIVNEEDQFSGKLQEFYVLEGDIKITESQMLEMVRSDIHHIGAVGEQYRIANLVNNNRTIRVLGFTGGGISLDNTMRTALQMAVENFNNLNIGLNFTLEFGSTNARSFDMVVSRSSGPGGGDSQFPSGGNPGRFISIESGTSSLGIDVTEHVITHEMGHAIGLRHTDFFNRSLSCGQGGNEGDAGVGAIHIPGTPTGFDPNSIMKACFDRNISNGEFSNFDVIALEFLY